MEFSKQQAFMYVGDLESIDSLKFHIIKVILNLLRILTHKPRVYVGTGSATEWVKNLIFQSTSSTRQYLTSTPQSNSTHLWKQLEEKLSGIKKCCPQEMNHQTHAFKHVFKHGPTAIWK